ncbi:MAG: SMI1/KNR4 family protein [Oscillospiraceae bacterium]|nr:SMI1/KNR4 family protein [Oscillospiraceae bacterium]MBR6923586.1 SMI1/KNR4 family protein [Oscillospiraceae bacterium]
MNNVLDFLKPKLSEDIYLREDILHVSNTLKDLEVSPSQEFIDFYTSYSGPFFEESLGFELLDIIDDSENIRNLTLACREQYEFENKFIVLTNMTANEVLILDTESDKVYRVDFEGGENKLKMNELKETWSSFLDFLKEYFGC